jgi:hypothetical protein
MQRSQMQRANLKAMIAGLVFGFHAAGAETLEPSRIEDKIAIKLGQKLTIQFQTQGHELKLPKVVQQPDPKRPTVTLDFNRHGQNLILHIHNGFSHTLGMRCLMRLTRQREYHETGILPVPALLSDFEGWRDPIEELVLFDFKLAK